MAGKTGGKPRRGAGKGRQGGSVTERVVAAALDLGSEGGWKSITLAGIAERAGLTLAQLHGDFPTKGAIAGAFLANIDQAVLAGGPADPAEPARDRLFEVLMRRFDALAPHKRALAELARGACAESAAACAVWPRFMRSMAWMVEAAGLSSSGLGGQVRVSGLALIYLNAFRVWLDDDSKDMAATMAALDKGLRQADRMAGLCCGLKRWGGEGEGEGEEAAAAG